MGHTAVIGAKPRRVALFVAQVTRVSDAVGAIAWSKATGFRRRAEFGGRTLDPVKRLQGLEPENVRLRKAVADLAPRRWC